MRYATYGNLLDLMPLLASKFSDRILIKVWQQNTAYNVNDILYYQLAFYEVNTAFTSGTTFSDTNLTKLSSGGGSGLEDWQPNHSYSVGDIFVAENQIWKVITAHTSGSTFSVTSDIEAYVPNELSQAQIQALVNSFNPSGSSGGGG